MEVRKKIRVLIEVELEGKMLRPLQVAEDDLVEIKMIFNQRGYENLLKRNLSLLSTDPETGEELLEIGFAQNIINRVQKSDGGYQEFKIKIDKAKRYITANDRAVMGNRHNKE